MEGIPDSWPPAPTVVPMFPLPHVWLFPYVVLPLHIFEPRYRQMVEDSLDVPGRIVLATIAKGHEQEVLEAPPVYPIGGLGEIGRHERLEDGRYNIWLVGLQRVQIEEVDSDRLYRKVAASPADENLPSPEEDGRLRQELTAAIIERTSEIQKIPPQVPLSHLTDLLILRMPLPGDVIQLLYSELDVSKRCRDALAEHAVRPHMARDEEKREGEEEDDENED